MHTKPDTNRHFVLSWLFSYKSKALQPQYARTHRIIQIRLLRFLDGDHKRKVHHNVFQIHSHILRWNWTIVERSFSPKSHHDSGCHWSPRVLRACQPDFISNRYLKVSERGMRTWLSSWKPEEFQLLRLKANEFFHLAPYYQLQGHTELHGDMVNYIVISPLCERSPQVFVLLPPDVFPATRPLKNFSISYVDLRTLQIHAFFVSV